MNDAAVQSTSFHDALAALHRGDLESTREILHQLIEEGRDTAAVHLLLGQLCEKELEFAAAERHFRRAAELNDSEADVVTSLARVLLRLRRPLEAASWICRGLKLHPGSAELHNSFGQILKSDGRFRDAIDWFTDAVLLDPRCVIAYANRGHCHRELSEVADAIADYEAALNVPASPLQTSSAHDYTRGSRAAIQFLRATILPIVAPSQTAVDESQARLSSELRKLEAQDFTVDPTDSHFPPMFYLAYQGWNDREFQQRIAGFCQTASADYCSLLTAARPADRIKVGFISPHFRRHTVGRLWEGLVTQLSRDRFEVEVLSLTETTDQLTDRLRRSADCFLDLSGPLKDACRRIAERRLDVLYFLDIGMTASSYALANCRLAPVQCMTWGHPSTSGLRTMDYFISSELFEDSGAEEHYTEQLVRLRNLGFCISEPDSDLLDGTPEDLGLPEDQHLYGCLQNTFKMHPKFDPLLAEILRRDPQGRLILLASRQENRDAILLERFRQTMPDVVDRIQLIPRRLPERCYFQALDKMHVILDPPQFGGGKTSLDAFWLGKPVVTLPSPYLKARLTAGLYRKMEITDNVAADAADYVDIAVRLGTVPAFREQISAKIQSKSHRLFNDLNSVREIEDFLVTAVERRRTTASQH